MRSSFMSCCHRISRGMTASGVAAVFTHPRVRTIPVHGQSTEWARNVSGGLARSRADPWDSWLGGPGLCRSRCAWRSGAREPSREAGKLGRLACPRLPNAVPRAGEPRITAPHHPSPSPPSPPRSPIPQGPGHPSHGPGSRLSGCREPPAPAYTAPPVRCPPSLVVHCNEPEEDHARIVGNGHWILYRGNAQYRLSI